MKFRALVHTCTSHQRHLKVLQACPSPSSQEPGLPRWAPGVGVGQQERGGSTWPPGGDLAGAGLGSNPHWALCSRDLPTHPLGMCRELKERLHGKGVASAGLAAGAPVTGPD